MLKGMYRILDVNRFLTVKCQKTADLLVHTRSGTVHRDVEGFLFLAWTGHVCVCQADVWVNEVCTVVK